jgi:hypothetical protein
MSGAGALGLVNDLSVKLAKQRKQLQGLVKEVKGAQDAQLKWYHYAAVLIINNLIIITLGFLLASAIYGITPSEGSFSAGAPPIHGLLCILDVNPQTMGN